MRSQPLPESVARRVDFFDRSHLHTPYLGVTTPVGRFVVRTNDRVVARLLVAKQRRGEMGTLRNALLVLGALDRLAARHDRLLIDVGANIGTTTVTALRAGFGRVIAFEPEPSNVTLLRVNVALNDVDDLVEVVPVALSDAVGAATLALDPDNSGGHCIVIGSVTPGPDPMPNALEVPCTTLDAHLAAHRIDPHTIGLLWMDVQGHEPAVLRGAESVLRAGVPTVLEYSPSLLDAAGELLALEHFVQWRYRSFVDLRVLRDPRADAHDHVRPTGALAELRSRYAEGFTDILLL